MASHLIFTLLPIYFLFKKREDYEEILAKTSPQATKKPMVKISIIFRDLLREKKIALTQGNEFKYEMKFGSRCKQV